MLFSWQPCYHMRHEPRGRPFVYRGHGYGMPVVVQGRYGSCRNRGDQATGKAEAVTRLAPFTHWRRANLRCGRWRRRVELPGTSATSLAMWTKPIG